MIPGVIEWDGTFLVLNGEVYVRPDRIDVIEDVWRSDVPAACHVSLCGRELPVVLHVSAAAAAVAVAYALAAESRGRDDRASSAFGAAASKLLRCDGCDPRSELLGGA
jgi:hypothetical protein